ncbi:ER membrane protein complex subunit 1 [Bienertia sinuspersici]
MVASSEGVNGDVDSSWLEMEIPLLTMATTTHLQPSSAIFPSIITNQHSQRGSNQFQHQGQQQGNSSNQNQTSIHHQLQQYQPTNSNHEQQGQVWNTSSVNTTKTKPSNTIRCGNNPQTATISKGAKSGRHLVSGKPKPNHQTPSAPTEDSSDDDLWSLGPDETLHYECFADYTEYNQVIEWFEDENDSEEANSHITSSQQQQHQRKKLNVLKNQDRLRVAAILLVHSHNCSKLPHGKINEIAKQFAVSRHTIQRIWREASKQYNAGQIVNVSSKKAGIVGRKRVTVHHDKVTEVPLRKRTTLRSLALALNMSKSTLYRMVRRGDIKSHNNAMKPDLTFSHKYDRVKWCVDSIIPPTVHTLPRFHLMQNIIHVDEKWFMMSKLSQKLYLAPKECEPYRACRSKRFLAKVMFLAAVARLYSMLKVRSFGMGK